MRGTMVVVLLLLPYLGKAVDTSTLLGPVLSKSSKRSEALYVGELCEQSRRHSPAKKHVAVCLIGSARTFADREVYRTLKYSIGGLASAGDTVITYLASIRLAHLVSPS